MASEYRIYWQPGCSSCLRAKEFLRVHEIPFKSINIHEHEDAREELAGLPLPVEVYDDEVSLQ